MLEATDKRVVSFVLDTIYNVTHGKVKTPKRIGLAELVKILTGSADLVKVRQIHVLSRVGDSFDIANGLLLDVENFLHCLHFSVNC